jgi:WXG100 family type VII secretion target
MANDAQVNPDQLRQFAAHLKKYSANLRAMDAETKSQMNHLSETWKDQKNREFTGKYTDAVKVFPSLCETLDGFSNYLQQSASIIDDYLRLKS